MFIIKWLISLWSRFIRHLRKSDDEVIRQEIDLPKPLSKKTRREGGLLSCKCGRTHPLRAHVNEHGVKLYYCLLHYPGQIEIRYRAPGWFKNLIEATRRKASHRIGKRVVYG